MSNNKKPTTERRRPAQAADEGAVLPAAPSPKKDISTLADANCKRCYGTGRLGYVMEKGVRKILACRCVKKNVFIEALRISREEHERKVRDAQQIL